MFSGLHFKHALDMTINSHCEVLHNNLVLAFTTRANVFVSFLQEEIVSESSSYK